MNRIPSRVYAFPSNSKSDIRRSVHLFDIICLVISCKLPTGAHDNGYMATLNQLGNEGLLEKVILLLGYERIAREIQNFNLPTIDTKGIFITRRMKTNKKSTNLSTLSAVRVEDFEKFRIGDSSKSPESHRSRSPIKPKQLDPSLVRDKLLAV